MKTDVSRRDAGLPMSRSPVVKQKTRRFAPPAAPAAAARQILCAVVFLLAAAGSAFALPTVECLAGFDGFYRPGEWTPVVITVRNQPSTEPGAEPPRAFQGVISIPSEGGDSGLRHIFTREIDIPAFSVQRYYVYARFSDTLPAQPVAELRTTNGKLLRTFPLQIQPLAPGTVLLLNVSAELTPASLPKLRVADPLVVAKAQPENLPENWWGLAPVGVVVLTNWSETFLRPAQEQALEEWVNAGGTLVAVSSGDPSAWRGGLMDRILPGTVEGGARLRLGEDGSVRRITDPSIPVETNDIVTALITPSPDAEVLAEAEKLPLVVRRHQGLGEVIFFAFESRNLTPSIEINFSNLWRSILPWRPITGSEYTFQADLRSNAPVVSRRAARPANIFLIFFLLIGYVLAVGPINFRMLYKRKKIEWAWVSVPCIVLVFSSLIYGIGALTKGGDLIVREASLIAGRAGENTAVLRGQYGIFSPKKTRMSARPESAALALARGDHWWKSEDFLRSSYSAFKAVSVGGGGSGGLLDIEQGPTIHRVDEKIQSVNDLPLGQWDIGHLETRGLIDMEGAVEADLVWNREELSGSIRNNTSRPLRRPILFYSDQALPLPRDLLPGDTYVLQPGSATFPNTDPTQRTSTRWRAAGELLQEHIFALRNLQSDEVRQAASTLNYLAHYWFEPDLTSKIFPPHGAEVWLIAFGEQPEAKIALSAKPDIFTHAVCYAIRLPLRPAPRAKGPLAPWQNRLEFLGQSVEGTVNANDLGDLEMRDSNCMVSAVWPFNTNNVSAQSVVIETAYTDAETQDFSIEILNLRTLRFEPVSIPKQTIDSSRVSQFVSPCTGRLFLKLTAKKADKPKPATPSFAIQLKNILVTYEITAGE